MLPAGLLPPHSPPPNLECRCCPPLLLSAVTIVVVHRCRCCRPPSPLSSSAAIVIHRSHLPPLQPSSPLRVSAASRRPLLSVPFVVRCPILHAVVVRCCHCPPLPWSSATPVFRRRSHYHHSAVSAVSHRPLSSFPIAVCHPITCVVIIRHHCHPPPSLSAVAVPPLVHVDCCVVSRTGPPQQVICDGINVPESGLLAMN